MRAAGETVLRFEEHTLDLRRGCLRNGQGEAELQHWHSDTAPSPPESPTPFRAWNLYPSDTSGMIWPAE
jgi:hypothetical protein